MFSVASSDGLVLSKDGYDKAMQKLLHLDFSDLKLLRNQQPSGCPRFLGSAVLRMTGLSI